jgi:Ca2+-binding RTX toxin-like protein
MPVSSETITLAGSGLIFENTYDASVTDGYRAAIITAENYLQAHFSDAVTIHADFDMEAFDSTTFIATNSGYGFLNVPFAQFTNALQSHATTADDTLAVNGLPTFDPSGGAKFFVPTAEARALGLFPLAPQPPFDVQVDLNSLATWSFGQEAVGAIIHELTEGAFGRISQLGKGDGHWAPLDLFRFTASGVRDYSGGADGIPTYFGLDPNNVSSLQYHNAISPGGANDGEDLGDWDSTFGDAFGPGGPGAPGFVSATDLQVLDILGWTPHTASAPLNPTDDFASSFSDLAKPMGHIAINSTATGALEVAGDRDWFQVTLGPGDYLIGEAGASGQAGTLGDPLLRVYDSTGGLVRSADDIIPGQDLDSRLVMHVSVTETYYIEAGAHDDQGTGSYTLVLAQGSAETTTGDDVMLGAITGSTIDAGTGDDIIIGRDASNYLRGADGDDTISGGALFDDINGNKGEDLEHGGEGADWVVGGQGNDVLYGDDGGDIVYGNLGNDTCDGGADNDLIRGGQGDDVCTGGDGNDWISGDRGTDTMTGGTGADTFHSFSGAGTDIVTDFNSADGDKVQLDAGTTYTLKQVGADTIVDMGNGDQLILKSVTLSTLPTGWIFTL